MRYITLSRSGLALGRAQRLTGALVIAAGLASWVALPAQAADVVKASNTTALNDAGSWVSGGPPGASDVAVWDSTLSATNTSALGGSLSWQGIRIASPGGAITIGATTSATLTLGSSGIDMSQATQNLTINPNLAIGANQNWTVAGGRTLTGIAGTTTSVGTGTGNIVMSRSAVSGFTTGTATINFNQNGNGTGWGGYSGNITVNSNVKVQSQGNAAAALGSGTLTLAGGQVAQANGNWTFGNNIVVTAASVVGNDSSSGLGRTMKLLGDLTSSNGSGLTFTNNVTGGTRTDNVGFLLAGANASTYGTTTISADSRVRVGGNSEATIAGTGSDAGDRGSLGTGDVILSASTSELAFTRTDAHTVANSISGLGTVVIGGTTTQLAGTSTQVVTFTGANTFTGATRVSRGTLIIGGAGVLGGGSYAGAITANATLAFDSTADQILSGAISGSGTLRKSNTSTLTLSGISSFSGTVDLTAGTLLLTDNNTFAGPVTIAAAGTLRVGNGGTAGFIGNSAAITNNGAMIWNRTNVTNVGNAISGSGSITQRGTGTLALTGDSTYTGTTIVNAGTLSLTGSLNPASTLAVGGGTFSHAKAAAQTLGGLTVNVGSSIVTNTNAGATNTLNLGAITRNQGGTVDFPSAAATDNVIITSTANTNGILGPWATVGSNWAANDGTGKVVAYAAYTDVARLTPGTIANDTTSNVRIVEGSGSPGNISLGASDTTINTLLQSTEGGAGATTINTASSTLRASGVLVAATAGSLTVGTAANSGSLTAATAGGDLILLNNAANPLTVNATITNNTSASSLTKAGTGDLILAGTNTYTGGTALGSGTIQVGDDAALGTGPLTINGGTLRTSGTTNRTLANNIVLTGNGSIVSDSTTSLGMRLNGVISGSGDFTANGSSTGILTLAGNNTFTGVTTVGSGYLAVTNNALANSSAVSLSGGSTRLYVGVNGTTAINNLSGASTASIRTDFTVSGSNAARTLSVNQSADGTYGGTFAEGGSRPISLVKTGAATLSLTNSGNAYTGSTTVNAGTLRIGGGGRISSGAYAGAISIAGGATLHHDSTAGQTFSGTMSGAGTLQKSNTGALQLTGANNTFSGLIDISAGDVVLNNAGSENGSPSVTMTGGRLILAAPFVGGTATIGNLAGTAGTINTQFGADVGIRTLQVNQTADGTFAGNLQDGGGSRDLALVKTGPAALTLSASNTYTGGTTLSQGTLVATDGTAFGSGGTVTINDANTGGNNTSLRLGSVTLARPISVANLGSGTVTLGSAPAVALPTFSGTITLAKDVTLDGSTNTDRLTFSGGIGGTGNVTVTGTNRVVFATTANTYAGSTTVSPGSILQLSTGGATATEFIPNASVVSMGAGSFLKLAKGSNNETIGGLTGSGTVRGHEGVASAASVLTISNAANHAFAGVLEDGGAAGSTLALTKSGAGTQTLSGANTYSGATTVEAGTLLVNGSLGSSSAVTVQAAGTLGGSGTVGGATTIFGTHSPGTSPGVQTFGNDLTYTGASVIWELTGNTATQTAPAAFDQVVVGGNLDFTSPTSLSLVFDQGSTVNWTNAFWNQNQEWLLYDVTGTTANFSNFSLNPQSWLDGSGNVFSTERPQASFSLRQAEGSGDIYIVYTVPEPGTLMLAGCGLALAAWRLARRRIG